MFRNLNFGALAALFLTALNFITCATSSDDGLWSQRRFFHHDQHELLVSRKQLKDRISDEVVPRHYDLRLMPILDNHPDESRHFTAPGEVTITVECLVAIPTIVLNAAELDISTDTIQVVESGTTTELPIQDVVLDPENEIMTIHLTQNLQVSKTYDVKISFVAIVAAPDVRTNGIYWSSYIDDNGQTRYLATTQFSRTRSFRKMLPSYDEPNKKATFSIWVGRENSYHSLSNMDIIDQQPIDGEDNWTWDIYRTTPIMPATIIAIIVSDYENYTVTGDPDFPKPCSVWGPPPFMKDESGRFGAETAAKTLGFFERMVNITYELPKIDSAAIPDFAAGAMENWGLNTYRVLYLLWNEAENTLQQKFRVANIIGHELAHQFFGNLVTHDWWNDWWLTEGTASYFEYESLRELFPGYGGPLARIYNDMQAAMEFDATSASVPIHGNFSDHYDLNPSVINYSKGSCLVAMLRGVLGEDHFLPAWQHYLKKRAYTAVDQFELFADLDEYVNTNGVTLDVSMTEFLSSWTLQAGFPLVRVSRASDSFVYISQERFTNPASRASTLLEEKLWHTPIFLQNADGSLTGSTPSLWIKEDVLMTSYNVQDTSQWLIVNPHGLGYYRVLYDRHFFDLLRLQLETNHEEIPTESRSMIIDDHFEAAFAGYSSITEAFEISDAFIAKEQHYIVWSAYLEHVMGTTFNLFRTDQTMFNALQSFVGAQISSVLTGPMGYVPDPEEELQVSLARELLMRWICPLGDSQCAQVSSDWMQSWIDTGVNPIPLDLRPTVYCAAAQGNFYDYLLEQFQLDPDTGDAYLQALACSSTKTSEVITLTLTSRPDLLSTALSPILRFAGNFEDVYLSLENTFDSYTPAQVATVISSLATFETSKIRIESLVTEHSAELEPVMDDINSALARIDENILWISSYAQDIYDYLIL